MQLDTVAKRSLEQMNTVVTYTDAVVDYILGKGYDEKFGARPIRRAVQTEIEDLLAEEFLKRKKIGEVTLDIRDGKPFAEVK
jgi:ATP-dependent Clp protease ATP-binding subunit ClpC